MGKELTMVITFHKFEEEQPPASGNYLLALCTENGGMFSLGDMTYSKRYNAWNVYDDEEEASHALRDTWGKYWADYKEIKKAIEKDAKKA